MAYLSIGTWGLVKTKFTTCLRRPFLDLYFDFDLEARSVITIVMDNEDNCFKQTDLFSHTVDLFTDSL